MTDFLCRVAAFTTLLKIIFMRYLILLFLPILFVAESCKAQSIKLYPYKKNDNSLLWEISGKGIRPSYLFGTFHLMCREDITLSINLKDIIKNADVVYFEVDIDDMAATIAAMSFIKMKNDTTLTDLFTPNQFKKIESYFKDSLGMPLSFLKSMKPMLLQALLYPKMMACENMSGMELALSQVASENKKDVLGLETFAFQASIFDSIPYRVQAAELLKTIDSMPEMRIMLDSMLTIYKSQNLSALDIISSEEFNNGNAREILLDNRNRNWVKQLQVLMNKKRLFVAVGAGHLGGKNGVIALLRKQGYIVKPIEN